MGVPSRTSASTLALIRPSGRLVHPPGRCALPKAHPQVPIIAHFDAALREEEFGLTRLYNLVDDGAYTDLKALHRELDVAVAAAYGWPASIAQDADAIVTRLLDRNRAITTGRHSYDPFGGSDSRQGTLA
jgi:hypothetical protein